MEDKVIKEFAEIIALTIIGVFTVYKHVKDWFIKKKNQNGIKKHIENNYKIHEKLVELRVELDANRVDVTQFHNGDYYTNNNSILKMSVSHEVLDGSTSSAMQQSQNILVSRFPEMFKQLATNDVYFVPNVDKLTNTELKSELKIRGTKSLFCIKLTNINGQMFGFLTVAFCHEANETIDVDKLVEYAGIISLMLR
jgi:hypothetical protein